MHQGAHVQIHHDLPCLFKGNANRKPRWAQLHEHGCLRWRVTYRRPRCIDRCASCSSQASNTVRCTWDKYTSKNSYDTCTCEASGQCHDLLPVSVSLSFGVLTREYAQGLTTCRSSASSLASSRGVSFPQAIWRVFLILLI